MVKRKKENFMSFMASVLQNSMLTGIPQIASAGNAPKKIIRALVFVMCVVGFIYQSLIFMRLYWEYKTVVDVQVGNEKTVDLPSLTICNYNGYIMSRFCSDPEMSHHCGKNVLYDVNFDWCGCVPRYCKNETLPAVPRWVTLEKMSYWPYEKYKKYLQTPTELIMHCALIMIKMNETATDCDFSQVKNIRCPNARNENMNVCYTIFSRLGQPDMLPLQVISDSMIFLILDPMIMEYSPRILQESIQISIHTDRAIINPYSEGFTVTPGTLNTFRLKKTVKKLLPAPYETDCIDYVEAWEARGGWGPTNERECIEECKKNESLKLAGCIGDMFMSPGNEVRCRSTDIKILAKVYECAKKCKRACLEETYQIVKDSGKKEDDATCAADQKNDELIEVRVHLDGMETTTYTYSPKYQNIETFSYLGGYVGMWLGISLVAVFDFLETVVVMFKYPFRRLQNYTMRKQHVEKIRKMHRDM